ncbi:MAG: HNH endonuclease, partial [Bifidobacteriaceae bacterium]|nr:HNH endonuclease [Bifidobacteriaceae bacterium]
RAAAGPPGALPCPEDWPANTVASDSYQAGAKLRLLLEARDRGCCVPNCSAPPGRCEADHRVPYDPARPAIEQTTGSNMQLLCKAHHQLKTHHGWAHNHDPATGQTTITPPHSPPVAAPPRE